MLHGLGWPSWKPLWLDIWCDDGHLDWVVGIKRRGGAGIMFHVWEGSMMNGMKKRLGAALGADGMSMHSVGSAWYTWWKGKINFSHVSTFTYRQICICFTHEVPLHSPIKRSHPPSTNGFQDQPLERSHRTTFLHMCTKIHSVIKVLRHGWQARLTQAVTHNMSVNGCMVRCWPRFKRRVFLHSESVDWFLTVLCIVL